jgi:hypothetical protein
MTYTTHWLVALSVMASVLAGCVGDGGPGTGAPSAPVTQWELITASTEVADAVYVEATDDYVVASNVRTGTTVLEGSLDALVQVPSLASTGNILEARLWTDGESVLVSTQSGPYIPVLAERRDGTWHHHWDAIGYGVYPIAASARDDVFLSAVERLVHFDGTAAHEIELAIGGPEVRAALKVPGGALWGLGRSFPEVRDSVHRWSGTEWVLDSTLPEGERLEALWGDESGPRFAIGSGIYERVGNGWTRSHAHLVLAAIAGISDNDLYAIGEAGTLVHFDGTAWSAVDVPTTEHLRGISISTREILIVTADGKLLRGVRD